MARSPKTRNRYGLHACGILTERLAVAPKLPRAGA
jgi:hypothetical protein